MAGKDDVENGLAKVGITKSKQPLFICCCCCCGLPSLVGLIILLCSITSLGPEEQLVLVTDGGIGKKVINGPQTTLVNPTQERSTRTATRLSPQEYAVVNNVRSGLLRHEPGPMLLWLGAWDEFVKVERKMVLQAREFMRLDDSFTGLKRVEIGPQLIVPGVFETAPHGVQKAIMVKSMQSVVVLNQTSGRLHTVEDEGLFFPEPYQEIVEVRNATILKEREYAIVREKLTGKKRHVEGPQLLSVGAYDEVLSVVNRTVLKQLEYAIVRDTMTGDYRHEEGAQLLSVGAYDEVLKVRPKIVLQKHQYVRLVDAFTGFARVVTGPALMVPKPSEDGPGGRTHQIKDAIVISSQISVILLNRTSGKKYNVSEEGIFVPGPYEDIVEVRRATVLKSQEYAVVKDEMTGKHVHYAGPQQLFVGPYEELIRVLSKVVLQKQEYLRLVDRRSGEESVVVGPRAVVPQPTECEKDYVKNCTLPVNQAIVMRADKAVLTLNKTTGVKRIVRAEAGGIFTPLPYEEILEIRNATVLQQQEYAVLKNTRNGSFSHVEGPTLLHLEAYEELIRVALKVVLQKFDYIRLVDELTGVERVVEGAAVLVPNPTEVSVKSGRQSKIHHEMVQRAVLIDKDHAVLVLNQMTGLQTLVTMDGMWVPAPYEHFVETRSIVRVMANEAVVVRDQDGQITVYDGTSGGAGTAFFLQPRSQIVTMTWTVYGMPSSNGSSAVSHATLSKIDMRIQRTFYSYIVRTNDNVELLLMGTIFWRVENVTKMMLGTSDPSGDVWHHCRGSLLQAVSNSSFDNFMGSFNTLAKDAYERDVADGFYPERGVALLSLEVTRFEAVDEETKDTLRQINEETTKQITLLKKQEGENAIKAAKMRADIALEQEQTSAQLSLESQKTNLIQTRIGNDLLEEKAKAEGEAQPFAQHAKSFISALNESGVDITSGVSLYKALREAEHHNKDTENLAGGKATLFLTSQDVKLNFRNLNFGDDYLNGTNRAHGGEL